MTVIELIKELQDLVIEFPDIRNYKVVCTDSIRFKNGLHEIDDMIVIDDNGTEKLQLW